MPTKADIKFFSVYWWCSWIYLLCFCTELRQFLVRQKYHFWKVYTSSVLWGV